MKMVLNFLVALLLMNGIHAQTEAGAGNWKTWFITSGKDYRLPPPAAYKNEPAQVIAAQKKLDATGMQQLLYWNAGAPGYRWHEMMNKIWTNDTSRYAILANMLLGTSIYDATVAAWHTKYTYNTKRPFAADKRIECLGPRPETPSFPCEYSVAAGAAVAIFSKFYPALADSVNRMAQQLMAARIAAGMAFPADTKAGFELGKTIAAKEIEHTAGYIHVTPRDGKKPEGPEYWNGPFALLPMAGKNKTAVLTSGSQFRPGPPPDFAKEMEELKKHKPTFRTLSNAFYWASQDFWTEELAKKIFEHNLHLNPPQAAKLYAIAGVCAYDGFISCWDAKYAYWGIRPNQYDTSYRPPILVTPPFPGYPSGHAMLGAVFCEVYSAFFPQYRGLFEEKAKQAAESRFQAGIHFRTDNEVALDMGKKAGAWMIGKLKANGMLEE